MVTPRKKGGMSRITFEELPGEVIASLQATLGPASEPEYEAASYSLEGALNALLPNGRRFLSLRL